MFAAILAHYRAQTKTGGRHSPNVFAPCRPFSAIIVNMPTSPRFRKYPSRCMGFSNRPLPDHLMQFADEEIVDIVNATTEEQLLTLLAPAGITTMAQLDAVLDAEWDKYEGTRPCPARCNCTQTYDTRTGRVTGGAGNPLCRCYLC